MKYILKFSELEKYFEKADFTDIKVFEGETTLRKFIASMLSFYPWWIVLLYRFRKLLVVILDLVKEPVGPSRNRFRFYVITAVFYKHWTGPVYLNLIRPFHHLVVSRMAQYGLKD